MSRFDHPLAGVVAYLAAAISAGTARALEPGAGWPRGRGLLLAHETGLELGSPAAGSLSIVAWTTGPLPAARGATLVGPDLPELAGSTALGRVAVARVRGDRADDLSLYLDLQEALASTALEGVAVRARPSSQSTWYRFGREALGRGLALAHLGAAVVADLEAVEGVEEAAVLFVTAGRSALAPLEEPAREAGRVLAAFIKSREEVATECDECEYADVCEERQAPGSEG